MEQDPIFILCLPRTGSSLLRYVLDSHESIWCPPEKHLAPLMEGLLDVVGAYSLPLTPSSEAYPIPDLDAAGERVASLS
jgi:hypothetical protein